MPAFASLENQRFGRLLVSSEYQKRLSSRRIRTFWKCICDCGEETWAQVNMLQSGHKKSCGCLWDSTLAKGEADLRSKYRSYKCGAKRRELEFKLTIREFKKIAKQDCHYCGAVSPTTKQREIFNGSAKINGIDRKDNLIGYINNNCLPCCKICNRAKGEMSYEEFIDLCERVSNHANTRKDRLQRSEWSWEKGSNLGNWLLIGL